MKSEFREVAEGLENIKVEMEGAMAIVTMNRPKAMNALNDQTLTELQTVMEYFAKDKDILGVIITGSGKAFVAGADISQMRDYGAEEGRDYAEFAQGSLTRLNLLKNRSLLR